MKKWQLQKHGIDSRGQLSIIPLSSRVLVSALIVLANTNLPASAAPRLDPSSPAHSFTASAAPKLDLSSPVRSFTARASATIKLGGTSLPVYKSEKLTAAESVALSQVLQSGHQSLLLSRTGTAVGGLVDFSSLGSSVSSLFIPHGVTALYNFSHSGLSLSGDLTNAGKFYAFSTNSAASANIYALDIVNERGALISSTLPAAALGLSNTLPSLNLNLVAANNVINGGVVSSSGNLSISASASIINSAGKSLVGTTQSSPGLAPGSTPLIQAAGEINLFANSLTNSGVIAAQAGNLNIGTLGNTGLAINNVGGVLQSLERNINISTVGTSAFNSNITLKGGNLLSQQLNINAGTGNIDVNAGNISGILNTQGVAVNVQAASRDLQIGSTEAPGDPTFFNVGNISIGNSLVFPGTALAIVATGNISSAAGAGSISTSPVAAGNGGAITLIAGANFSANGPNTGPTTSGTPDNSSTIKILGASASGGSIDLTGAGIPADAITSFTSASSTSGSGGNITLVAFAGKTSGSGAIKLPATLTLNAGGTAGNANGNVLIIAGQNVPVVSNGAIQPALQVGGINTAGTATSGGNISLLTATPVFAANTSIQAGVMTGSVSAGTSASGGGIVAGSALGGTAPITSGGTFTASTAGALTVGDVTAAHNISLATTANNSSISITGNIISTGGTVNVSANGTGSIQDLNQVLPAAIGLSGGKFPVGAVPSPDGAYLFVPDYFTNQVFMINTASNQVVNTLSGFSSPQGTAITEASGVITLYVANYGNSTVSTVTYNESLAPATATVAPLALLSPLPSGSKPEALALSPDGSTLYISSDTSSGAAAASFFSQVNTVTGQLKSIPVGLALVQTGGIAVNPQGTLAWVSNAGSKSISVINLASDSIAKTIDLSSFGVMSPNSLTINPNGTRIFVSEGFANLPSGGHIVDGAMAIIDALPTSKTFNQLIGTVSFGNSNTGTGSFPQGISSNATGTETFTQSTYNGVSGGTNLNTQLVYANSSPLLSIGIPTQSGTDGIGSSNWSTVINSGGVNNLTSYTSNTHNDLSGATTPTVSVVQEPTIKGNGVTLSAGGLIIGSYDASGGSLAVNNSGKNGQVILSNVGTQASSVSNSSSTGLFQIGSLQPLTITGKILSPNIILQTTANNSGITIGNGSTAAQVGQAGATVTISTTGTGAISTNGSSTIVGASVVLNSVNGIIGPSTAVNTVTQNISVNSAAQANISNTGAVTVNPSIAAGFALTNAGAITYPAGGSINATTISLATTTGSIILNAPLGTGTAAGDDLTLKAGGSGTITQASNAIITGDVVTLACAGCSLGSASTALNSSANTLAIGSGTSIPASAFVFDNLPATLETANVTQTLNLTVAGNISVTAPASNAQSITLQTTNNGNVDIKAVPGLVTGSNNPKSTVTYIAGGTGVISDVSSTIVNAGVLSMQTVSGSIGASLVAPIITSAANLQVNTPGSVFISAQALNSANSYSLGVNSSSAGSIFNLSVQGNANINGAVSAPSVNISTTASLGGTSQIVLAANLGQSGTGNSVTLQSQGAANKDDSIIFKSGTILSPVANLSVGNGSIGSSLKPVLLNVQQVSASALAGSVFLNNTGALDFSNTFANGAKDTFSLKVTGGITVDQPINAGTVTLQTLNNGSITIATTAGNGITGTAITLNANGSGGLFTNANGFVGNNLSSTVSLISGSGNIGTPAANFAVAGGTTSVLTTGNAFISATGTSMAIGKSTLGSNSLLDVTSAGAPITVQGPVSAGNITFNVAGALTITGSVTAKSAVTVNETGANQNVEGGPQSSLSGASVMLSVSGGNLGDTAALGVSSPALTVSTSGSATLTSTAAVNLTSATTGGNFSVSGSGAISTSGALNVTGTLNLQSNGNITLGGNLTSSGTATLNSGGQLTYSSTAIAANPSLTITAPTVSLTSTSTTGNIGSATLAIPTVTGTLDLSSKGNAFVNNTGNVSLGTAFNGTLLSLFAVGSITTEAINSKSIALTASGSGSTITCDGNVGSAASTVVMSAVGSMNSPAISEAASINIVGNTVTLATNNGDIGSSASPLSTTASSLILGGNQTNAFVKNSGAAGSTLNLFTTTGANFSTINVTTSANLTTKSSINGITTVLSTTNGNILVPAGTVVGTGSVGGTTATITAGGAGTIMTTNSSGFITDTLNLNSGSGNMGTSATPVLFITLQLNVSSTSGSATLLDVGRGSASSGPSSGDSLVLSTVTAAGSKVGGALTLITQGSSLTTKTITAGSLSLTQQGGSVSGGGALTVSGVISVNNGAANIIQQGIGGLNVTSTGSVSSTGGNIDLVQQAGTVMTVSGNLTANNGSITIQNTNAVSGSIQLGTTAATTIKTNVTATHPAAGEGTITIVDGALPAPLLKAGASNFPVGVTITTPVGNANAYAGANGKSTFSASSGTGITLFPNGGNIIFAGRANSITLGNNLNITADPPVSVAIPVVHLPSAPGRLEQAGTPGQLAANVIPAIVESAPLAEGSVPKTAAFNAAAASNKQLMPNLLQVVFRFNSGTSAEFVPARTSSSNSEEENSSPNEGENSSPNEEENSSPNGAWFSNSSTVLSGNEVVVDTGDDEDGDRL